jgi:hypothetical protein
VRSLTQVATTPGTKSDLALSMLTVAVLTIVVLSTPPSSGHQPITRPVSGTPAASAPALASSNAAFAPPNVRPTIPTNLTPSIADESRRGPSETESSSLQTGVAILLGSIAGAVIGMGVGPIAGAAIAEATHPGERFGVIPSLPAWMIGALIGAPVGAAVFGTIGAGVGLWLITPSDKWNAVPDSGDFSGVLASQH